MPSCASPPIYAHVRTTIVGRAFMPAITSIEQIRRVGIYALMRITTDLCLRAHTIVGRAFMPTIAINQPCAESAIKHPRGHKCPPYASNHFSLILTGFY